MRNYTDSGYKPFQAEGQYSTPLVDVAATPGQLLAKVLGLLTFAFLFTVAGVLVGTQLGPGSFLLALIGLFASLFILMAMRNRAPWNLVLLYAMATFEGMLLGPLLDSFIRSGMGNIVLDAAAGTAGVTFLAGSYGYATRRNVSGIRGILFVGLIGIIIASVVGIFVHLTGLSLLISVAAVALFSGFVIYDFNRLAKTQLATEGDAIMFAVSVYLDMINIFVSLLNILSIVGGGGGGSRRS
ncbi:MAG TPA: Bax inhibitor-1/YccA family protein [Chloroflexota bacterium]|jgi:modulator of FtsH protease|nr:Bax inhibitor-1/YccA family protein [Chloroflexota bacterium]